MEYIPVLWLFQSSIFHSNKLTRALQGSIFNCYTVPYGILSAHQSLSRIPYWTAISLQEPLQRSTFHLNISPYTIYICTVRSTEVPPKFNIQLLYNPLYNIYMSCKITGVPSKFNIQLWYSPQYNRGMSCELTRVTPKLNIELVAYVIFTCPVSSPESFQSSILNFDIVPNTTHVLSSLNTLHNSISNFNELTQDFLKFNISLPYLIYICEPAGHPPEFNIQLQ